MVFDHYGTNLLEKKTQMKDLIANQYHFSVKLIRFRN